MTTHERILDAAEALFATQGYAATTTRALAIAAGVNEVTLFRRFGSKAAILREVGQRIAHESARFAVEAVPEDLPLAEALTVLAHAEVGAARRHGLLVLRLAFESGTQPEVAEALMAGATGNRASVAGFLGDRQARGELRTDLPVELLTEAFFALTSSLVLSRALVPGSALAPAAAAAATPQRTSDDELVDQLVTFYRSGAQPPPPSDLDEALPAAPHPHDPGRTS